MILLLTNASASKTSFPTLMARLTSGETIFVWMVCTNHDEMSVLEEGALIPFMKNTSLQHFFDLRSRLAYWQWSLAPGKVFKTQGVSKHMPIR